MSVLAQVAHIIIMQDAVYSTKLEWISANQKKQFWQLFASSRSLLITKAEVVAQKFTSEEDNHRIEVEAEPRARGRKGSLHQW